MTQAFTTIMSICERSVASTTYFPTEMLHTSQPTSHGDLHFPYRHCSYSEHLAEEHNLLPLYHFAISLPFRQAQLFISTHNSC